MAAGVSARLSTTATRKMPSNGTSMGESARRPNGSGAGQPHGYRAPHPLAGIADDAVQQIIQIYCRSVAHEAMNLRQVGDPATHVLERPSIDLLVGHGFNGRLAPA